MQGVYCVYILFSSDFAVRCSGTVPLMSSIGVWTALERTLIGCQYAVCMCVCCVSDSPVAKMWLLGCGGMHRGTPFLHLVYATSVLVAWFKADHFVGGAW
ncbi:unnamed protein product [Choristocarpus tenellus]